MKSTIGTWTRVAVLLGLSCFGCSGGGGGGGGGVGTTVLTGSVPVQFITSGRSTSTALSVIVSQSTASTLAMALISKDDGLDVTPIGVSTSVLASKVPKTYDMPINIQSNGAAIGTLRYRYQGTVAGSGTSAISIDGLVKVRSASSPNFSSSLSATTFASPSAVVTFPVRVPVQYRGDIQALLTGVPAGTLVRWRQQGSSVVLSTGATANLPVDTNTSQVFEILLDSIPPDNADLNLSLTDGKLTVNMPFALTGPVGQANFKVSSISTILLWAVGLGLSYNYFLTITSQNSWAGTITFTAPSLPAGFSPVFAAGENPLPIASGETKHIIMRLNCAAAPPYPTSFDFVLKGTGSGASSTVQSLALSVRPFP